MTPIRGHDGGEGTGEALRQPPHNYEAERALLGAIFMNNGAFDRVADFLLPEHFADPTNGRLYEFCAMLINQGIQANPVTLKSACANDDLVQAAGGMKYLASLAAGAVTVLNATEYGRIVFDLWLRRCLIEKGHDLINEAYDSSPDTSGASIAESIVAVISELLGEGSASTIRTLGALVAEAIERHQAVDKGEISGFSTGLQALDLVMGMLEPGNLTVVAGRPGMGKEQPLNAPVLMADGTFKMMGHLCKGDRLASIDGAPSTVTNIFPQGVKQIFRVAFSDGRSTETGADHLWRVTSCRWAGARVMKTSEIQAKTQTTRYKNRICVEMVSGDFGTDRTIIMDPWLLGTLLSNGSFRSRTPRLTVSDAQTIDRVKGLLGDRYSYAFDGRFTYSLGLKRRGQENLLRRSIEDLGLWGLKSERKFIPPQYLTASKETRIALLQGLMDGDGWVEKFGVVRYCSSSKRLAHDVQRLARSLGAKCTISERQPWYTHNGERKRGLTAYTCNIIHPSKADFIALLRKKICVGKRRYHPLTFSSIEPSRVAEARCISVSHPSHLYVTDDYIVTHNSALSVTILYHVATFFLAEAARAGRKPQNAVFFSQEMTDTETGDRVITAKTGIRAPRARAGELPSHLWHPLMKLADDLRDLPFLIEPRSRMTLSQIKSTCRRLQRKGGVGIVVVDYLQIMGVERGRKFENRNQEVGYLATGLKDLAKELKCPVIALCQLSRAVENREDKRPHLADLRESGEIEQAADVVAFCYREEYYLENAKPQQKAGEDPNKYSTRVNDHYQALEACRGKADVIVGKARHGRPGTAHLMFRAERTWFEDPPTVAPENATTGPTEPDGRPTPPPQTAFEL